MRCPEVELTLPNEKVFPFQVSQGLDASLWPGDELTVELEVFFSAHQGDRISGPLASLDKGEPAVPHHIQFLGRHPLNRRRS